MKKESTHQVEISFRVGKYNEETDTVSWITHETQNLISDWGFNALNKWYFADMTRFVLLGTGTAPTHRIVYVSQSGYTVTGTTNCFVEADATNHRNIIFATGQTARIIGYIDAYRVTVDVSQTVSLNWHTLCYTERNTMSAPVILSNHIDEVSEGSISNSQTLDENEILTISNTRSIIFDSLTEDTLFREIGWGPEGSSILSSVHVFGRKVIDLNFHAGDKPYVRITLIRTVDCSEQSVGTLPMYGHTSTGVSKIMIEESALTSAMYSTIGTDGNTVAPTVPTLLENVGGKNRAVVFDSTTKVDAMGTYNLATYTPIGTEQSLLNSTYSWDSYESLGSTSPNSDTLGFIQGSRFWRVKLDSTGAATEILDFDYTTGLVYNDGVDDYPITAVSGYTHKIAQILAPSSSDTNLRIVFVGSRVEITDPIYGVYEVTVGDSGGLPVATTLRLLMDLPAGWTSTIAKVELFTNTISIDHTCVIVTLPGQGTVYIAGGGMGGPVITPITITLPNSGKLKACSNTRNNNFLCITHRSGNDTEEGVLYTIEETFDELEDGYVLSATRQTTVPSLQHADSETCELLACEGVDGNYYFYERKNNILYEFEEDTYFFIGQYTNPMKPITSGYGSMRSLRGYIFVDRKGASLYKAVGHKLKEVYRFSRGVWPMYYNSPLASGFRWASLDITNLKFAGIEAPRLLGSNPIPTPPDPNNESYGVCLAGALGEDSGLEIIIANANEYFGYTIGVVPTLGMVVQFTHFAIPELSLTQFISKAELEGNGVDIETEVFYGSLILSGFTLVIFSKEHFIVFSRAEDEFWWVVTTNASSSGGYGGWTVINKDIDVFAMYRNGEVGLYGLNPLTNAVVAGSCRPIPTYDTGGREDATESDGSIRNALHYYNDHLLLVLNNWMMILPVEDDDTILPDVGIPILPDGCEERYSYIKDDILYVLDGSTDNKHRVNMYLIDNGLYLTKIGEFFHGSVSPSVDSYRLYSGTRGLTVVSSTTVTDYTIVSKRSVVANSSQTITENHKFFPTHDGYYLTNGYNYTKCYPRETKIGEREHMVTVVELDGINEELSNQNVNTIQLLLDSESSKQTVAWVLFLNTEIPSENKLLTNLTISTQWTRS